MGKKEFEASLADGRHQRLARMAGEWEGTFKLWFEADKLACESPQRGSIRPVAGGRFLLHEYHSSFGLCTVHQPSLGITVTVSTNSNIIRYRAAAPIVTLTQKTRAKNSTSNSFRQMFILIGT